MSDPETPDALPPPEAEATAPGTAQAGTAPAEAGPAPDAAAPAADAPVAVRRHRHPFYLRGRRLRLPSSKGGLFALLMVLAGLGGVSVFTGVSLIHWTETPDFCGRCHTMAPELQAYEAGPHSDVTCGECHVEPGITGWVKAKFNGTRQLVQIVLGTFPEPIPPPDHDHLPSAEDTCAKCHDVGRDALAVLKTRTQFAEDEANTRQFVGLLIRPGGGDVFNVDRSVHWHVLRTVTYRSEDPRRNTIDYVAAITPSGELEEFIAQDKITMAEDIQPDIDALRATGEEHTMTCYDCHNRIGHAIPNPRNEVDYKLSTGQMDATLPYVKREAMRVLWAGFPDDATADAAADRLVDFYETNYPGVAQSKAAQIATAVDQIKVLYRLTSTPEMRVSARTYPDHLGHMDFPGCFRCHDGGHYLVKDGVVTNRAIPSTCDVCHTFPQLGPAVASLPLGEPPSTHDDGLWVFNHKGVTTDLDPGGTSCGECHARDYCVNCHATGAVTVGHDTMATNHAKVIRDQGNTACAYCHQPVYCARCHADPVLPITSPSSEGSTRETYPDLPTGVSWPLTPRT